MMRLSLVVVLAGMVALGGCASASPAPSVTTPATAMAPTPPPAPLPPPRTPAEAQMFLSASIAALRAGQGAHAALFLDAILRSDHLTDRGRANLYWLLADAHRARLAELPPQAGEARADRPLVDALGGFLIASEVIEPDAELGQRQVEARAILVAARIQSDPLLGLSPESPISVEDARDPAGVVADLRCGPREERYYERAVSNVGGLESRQLVCASDGTLRTLWFDLSGTR